MIQINLLQNTAGRSAKQRKAAAGLEASPAQLGAAGGGGGGLVFMVVLIMVALNGGFGWMAYSKVAQAKASCDVVIGQCDKLKKEIDRKKGQADQIEKYHEVVANQMDVLKSLDPPDRILWSLKFNMLANLMPVDVFVEDVTINEVVTMVETQQSIDARQRWTTADEKKRGQAPPEVKKPVIHYEMRITGLAQGRDNVEQFNNMLKLHEAMTNYSMQNKSETVRFMDGFNENIEFESVESTVYEGAPVNKFIIKLTTKDMGMDTQPADAAHPNKLKVHADQIDESVTISKESSR